MLKFVLFLLLPLIASADPLPGNFDWKQILGDYDFGPCEVAGQTPIWSGAEDKTFIRLEANPVQPENFDIMRFSKDGNPLVLEFPFETINRGTQKKVDPDTGKVTDEANAYTTRVGIFGFLSWNFKDINVGWMTTEIRSKNGVVEYFMQLRYKEDSFTRAEHCILKKLATK